MTQPEKRAACRQSLSLLLVMTMTAAGVLTGVSSELIVDRHTWDKGLPSILPIHEKIEEEGIPL
jgi:hypothetical protein